MKIRRSSMTSASLWRRAGPFHHRLLRQRQTTLLRCPNFLETPDAGTITVQDKVLFDAAQRLPSLERRNPEKAAPLRHGVPVLQPLSPIHGAGKRRWHGSRWPRTQAKARKPSVPPEWELLAQMGLADRADHYPHQFPAVSSKRVAIARALALHPDILFASTSLPPHWTRS